MKCFHRQKQIYNDRKQISGSLSQEWWEMGAKGHSGAFWVMEMFYILIVMVEAVHIQNLLDGYA